MIDALAEWFRRVTHGATSTKSSLVRIHLWALAALLISPLFLPARPAKLEPISLNGITIESNHTRFVGLDANDPRGFSNTPSSDANFDIAWISGSSLRLVADDYYEVLPDLVGDKVGNIDGRPVDTDVFFLQAMRIFDEYVALLAAIDSNPDLIVLTLNPMFLFNDQAVQNWGILDGRAAGYLLDRPESWPLAVQLISPTDALWGTAGARIAPLEQRWAYGQSLRNLVDNWDPLDRSELPATNNEPSELAQIQAMGAPLDFWSTYRDDIFSRDENIDRQLGFLELSTTGGGTVNDQILSLMARAVRDSGIPTYVYLAPINPVALDEPEVEDLLSAVENGLLRYQDDFAAQHIRFSPLSLSRSIPRLPFNDLVHLGKAEPIADILAEDLCSFLTSLDSSSSCTMNGEDQ